MKDRNDSDVWYWNSGMFCLTGSGLIVRDFAVLFMDCVEIKLHKKSLLDYFFPKTRVTSYMIKLNEEIYSVRMTGT
jgi:hypothetical protein